MEAFVAVCDAGGFAAAARRLGRSPPVVTRLIAELEDRLGVRLLHRTTRSLRLTEAGAAYLERARRILHDIEEAELSAQDQRSEPRGRLAVTAPTLFGRIHVAPIVSAMLERFPRLAVDLELSDRFANLVDEGLDVAIRIGALEDSSLVARRLGQTRRVLVAAPDYLARAGSPRHPTGLVDHALIAFRPITAAREWRFLDPASSKPIAVAIEPRFASSSGDAAIGHALAGGGITAALSYQVRDAIEADRLVEILRDYAPPPVPIQAVFSSSRLLSAKVRRFLDALEDASKAWRF